MSGGKLNIDLCLSSLKDINRDIYVRMMLPKDRYEEVKGKEDVYMIKKVGESDDYIVVDIALVVVRNGIVIYNMLGMLLIASVLT